MRRSFHRGFTLLELLIVVAIMGLLGTVSVSGFRGLRKGMEVRGTMQTVDEFVRSAYRRAVIDRVPVSIYFWNETISDEKSDASADKKLIVVGRAAAVRRAGRVTAIDGDFLVDEFGDLSAEVYTDEDGQQTDPGDYEDDAGRYLYRMKTDSFERSVVSSITVNMDLVGRPRKDYLMSRPDNTVTLKTYGYYVKPGAQGEKVIGKGAWKVGDPYGFAIAELTLPKNYIFGSGSDYSKSVKDPERAVDVIAITGSGRMSKRSMKVSGLKLDKSGAVSFDQIGESGDPTQDRN